MGQRLSSGLPALSEAMEGEKQVQSRVDERETETDPERYDVGPSSLLDFGVVTRNGWELRDFNQLLELLQFFCFERKPRSHFAGAVTFVFPPPKAAGESVKDMVFTLVFDPSMSSTNEKETITLMEGCAPDWVPVVCEVRVPADIFHMVYSNELSAKEITKLVLKGELNAKGWTALAKFGYGYEYSKASWRRFYFHRTRLREAGLWPEYTPLSAKEKSKIIFSSQIFEYKTKEEQGEGDRPAPPRGHGGERPHLTPQRQFVAASAGNISSNVRTWWSLNYARKGAGRHSLLPSTNFHCTATTTPVFGTSNTRNENQGQAQVPGQLEVPDDLWSIISALSSARCEFDISDWTCMGWASLAALHCPSW